ncbi:MAG: hypothetical protein LUC85_04615 [Bacteroidales bacterium]|nr:hypothetical protein [Bacteroidales bacterium]MCD8394100.1 hypothetical protein [Bacteroidales bacterium]
MADGYIGKQMDDYRAGRLGRPTPSRRLARVTARRVLVLDGTTPDGVATIERLRAQGCRVAFADPDTRRGAALAQRTGARHYPLPPEALEEILQDLQKHWGPLDAIL